MNVKLFRWPLLSLTLFLFYRACTTKGIIGLTASTSSNGSYRFAAGTSPQAIECSAALILLYILFLYSPPAKGGAPIPGVFRRWNAFWLDFIYSMIVITPLVGIGPVLVEWRRTGVFAWSFVRYSTAPYDGWLSAILMFGACSLMALYFSLPLVLNKPTPGSCMMGYQIVGDDGEGLTMWEALKRICFGFIAVCGAWGVNYKPRNKEKGKFWLDFKFNTHAVRLD